CWNGFLGVNLLEVCLGHEYPDKEYGGDPNQGLLLVQVYAPDRTNVRGDVYKTPGAFGPMHFIVADSISVTIASDDGQHIFTFDIPTSQWVPNPPSVLLTTTPIPPVTSTPASKQEYETRIAQRQETAATQAALTPKPPYTSMILQTRSPLPATPTWPEG